MPVVRDCEITVDQLRSESRRWIIVELSDPETHKPCHPKAQCVDAYHVQEFDSHGQPVCLVSGEGVSALSVARYLRARGQQHVFALKGGRNALKELPEN